MASGQQQQQQQPQQQQGQQPAQELPKSKGKTSKMFLSQLPPPLIQ